MRSAYLSSRVIPLPSIPENEFLITPENVELENHSAIMEYSLVDPPSLPKWESDCDESTSKQMECRMLQWPFYMLLGLITVAILVSIAWDNLLTCIVGRNMGLNPGH
ncbi:hypothetical protein N7513_005835 [Penicillium frequentans]|nr:hypothetical protein N7513_005835 [Penicillium glabrum]